MRLIKLFTILTLVVFFNGSALGQQKAVNYSDGDSKLQGYLSKATVAKAKIPGIIIIPAWFGITDHEKEAAEKLAMLGYHALTADIYGPGNTPKTPQEAGEKSGYYKTNFSVFQSRIKAAINEIVKQGADPEQIVVMGYCFGGTGALEAARADLPVKGVVSFHGGLGKDSKRSNTLIKPSVLVLHGADDPYVPAADITSFQQEMRDGKADWQMIYYADAVHAFTEKKAGNDNSKGAAYNEKADKRSWEHMKLFLKQLFM